MIKKSKQISAMGMVGIVALILTTSVVVAPLTSWLLGISKSVGENNSRLEAVTVSQSEWERLQHMSLGELRSNKTALATPYKVGEDFQVKVNLGAEGYFSNGKCENVPSGKNANCFKDTTITVFNSDGDRLFSSRQLPLQVGLYTTEEIDSKLTALQTKINNEATTRANADSSLTSRLNGNEFIKNKTTGYNLNLRYEKKSGDDGYKLHAYNGNAEILFASGGINGTPTEGWTQLPNGLIMQWGTVTMTNFYQQFSFNKAFPHRCFEVIISPVGNTVDRSACFFPDTITTTSFYVYGQDANRDGDKRTGTMMWFAIGY